MKFSAVLGVVFFCNVSFIHSQTMVRMNDENILAQEKRQVFENWGNFKPSPKYLTIFGTEIGPQLNPHYTMTWSWGAPARNKRYKDGEYGDIRPLSPLGLQTTRYASSLSQGLVSKEVKEEVDLFHEETLNEQLHVTALTAEADPLYLLYYKEKLKDFEDFDVDSTYWLDWGFSNSISYNDWVSWGGLEERKKSLELLKEKRELAKKADMPRGKRILLYHEIMLEWQRHLRLINSFDKNVGIKWDSEQELEILDKKQIDLGGYKDDLETFTDTWMEFDFD